MPAVLRKYVPLNPFASNSGMQLLNESSTDTDTAPFLHPFQGHIVKLLDVLIGGSIGGRVAFPLPHILTESVDDQDQPHVCRIILSAKNPFPWNVGTHSVFSWL